MKNYGRQILRKWNIFRVFFFILSFCLCAGNLILTPQAANSATASTVRLSKTEGTVEVSDSTGKAAVYLQNMRLANGDHTVTGERSYAWLSLDDTKVIKEDAVSNVEVRKRGQKMEVLVNSGSVFFNITEPLKEDENLNIRTSTMVMGVRGTCGVIKGVSNGVTCLQLLTGHLECIVTNPNTGDTKTISLDAGDEAYFYADITNQSGVANIVIERLVPENINGFVLMELVGDQDLINKIREESGLDFSAYTIDDARARLRRDQDETAAKNHQPLTINNRRINNGIKDPVWEKDKEPQTDTTSSDDSDGSGSNPTKSRVVRLTMKVTAQEVQDYLNDPEVDQVILMPNQDTSQNTLDVDIDLNVPEGKTLTTQQGVYVDVRDGSSATVNGTANLSDTLTNNGEIWVNSSNTLRVDADVNNYGSFVNTESGRTIVRGKFIGFGDGALENRGRFEGTVSGEGMFFQNQGTMRGELMGVFRYMELTGGTLTGNVNAVITELFGLEGGAVSGTVGLAGDTASFKLTGGEITASSENAALTIEAGDLSNVYLDGATVTNNGRGLAFKYGGSGTLNYSGGTVFRTRLDDLVVEPAIAWWDPVTNGSYYELQEAPGYNITFVKDDVFSELSILVNGTAAAGGKAKAMPGDTVELVFENTASDKAFSINYYAEDASGTLIPDIAGDGVIEPGANLTRSFTMGDSDLTMTIEGSLLYMVEIDRASTAFRDRPEDQYTLGGEHQLTGYFAEGEPVEVTLTADAAETGNFIFEARNADGKLFSSGTDYSYGTFPVSGGATVEFRFDMPAGSVSVTGEAFNEDTTVVHLESSTVVLDEIIDVVNSMSMGSLIIRAGVGSDSFTIETGDEMMIGSDTGVIISEGVTLNLKGTIGDSGNLRNNGVISVGQDGLLLVSNVVTNNGDITIETGGTFTVEPPDGRVTNASGATFTNKGTETHIGNEFQNDGTISNMTGATMYVDSDGLLTNDGTFNNEGTVTNNGRIQGSGTFINVSPNTFNNYGTFVLGEGGVFVNGDGAGKDGVANNFADGVILNSGTMVNNDGSIFRNYGSFVEGTAGAVSPELTEDSVPVVRYGSDCIPEGAVGGACGDTLFWYFEELEEEEAEKLRRFTEGHNASASDAERAEDDASVSYILHITGSGAMDDFTLEGGNSTAPWFEELDGAIRAVKIDEGLTQIGKNAFYGIRTLAYVSFAGTEEEWKGVKNRNGNEALDKAVLLFGGDDDLVFGDPLLAEDEEVKWTEPEAKPAAGKATASDAEKEEQKEQGGPEQEVPEQEVPRKEEPEKEEPEAPWNGKQEEA